MRRFRPTPLLLKCLYQASKVSCRVHVCNFASVSTIFWFLKYSDSVVFFFFIYKSFSHKNWFLTVFIVLKGKMTFCLACARILPSVFWWTLDCHVASIWYIVRDCEVSLFLPYIAGQWPLVYCNILIFTSYFGVCHVTWWFFMIQWPSQFYVWKC